MLTHRPRYEPKPVNLRLIVLYHTVINLTISSYRISSPDGYFLFLPLLVFLPLYFVSEKAIAPHNNSVVIPMNIIAATTNGSYIPASMRTS
jgi:hypothetical protein